MVFNKTKAAEEEADEKSDIVDLIFAPKILIILVVLFQENTLSLDRSIDRQRKRRGSVYLGKFIC